MQFINIHAKLFHLLHHLVITVLHIDQIEGYAKEGKDPKDQKD